MRPADHIGAHGEVWRVPRPVTFQKPDHEATLGMWIVSAPYAHPAWHMYSVSVVHLRDIPGAPPANKRYPEAEYELTIWALDPNVVVDPDVHPLKLPILTPPNLVHQFHGVTDEQARAVTGALAYAFVDGLANPDTDFRTHTVHLLRQTIEHLVLGGHPKAEA